MDNIDNFFNSWNNISQPIENNSRLRKYGNLDIEISRSFRYNVIRVNSLKSNKRRNGEATAFVKWLCKQSDKHGFLITLAAQPFGIDDSLIPNTSQLVSWFKKHSFTEKYEYPKGVGTEMLRVPGGGTLANDL